MITERIPDLLICNNIELSYSVNVYNKYNKISIFINYSMRYSPFQNTFLWKFEKKVLCNKLNILIKYLKIKTTFY